MTTIDLDTFRLEHLGPEPKAVVTSTGFDDDYDDGYDFIADTAGLWNTIGAWGRDGWNLGDWPYVIVQLAQNDSLRPELWTVRVRVEGDLDTWTFASREDAVVKIDHIAWWYWLRYPDRHGITPAEMAADPARFRGPFTWARMSAETEEAG